MRCLCCASAVFSTIADTLAHEECVTIAGFGTFATITREAPRRQNPRTGDSIAIAASTAPWFWRGRLSRMPSTRGTHDPMLSMHLPLPSTEMATSSGEVSVAIEGLQDALRQRKATLAEIAHQAEHGGVSP